MASSYELHLHRYTTFVIAVYDKPLDSGICQDSSE